MRGALTTLGEIAGIGLITTGLWLVFAPAALIFAGGALVFISFWQERR